MEENFVSNLSAAVKGTLSAIRKSKVILVEPESLQSACSLVADSPDFSHLSTVTAVDEGLTISIYYHFWKGKEFLTIKTQVPKSNPRVQSVSGILPSSVLYEAEVKDLFGVTFDGNPFMTGKLLLPDNYPSEAPPPLRKEADPEKIRKLMGLE